MKIGIKGLTFDAAHYTPGTTKKCMNLHGHTFTVDIEIEGEPKETNGMIMDFLEIKKIVKSVLEKYDHKIILPKKDRDNTIIKGNFNTEILFIEYPFATTECIALSIAKEIHEKIKKPFRLRVYEGKDKYAEVEIKE